MIPETVDRVLFEFETHNRSPSIIQKAARLLEKLIGRLFDAELIAEIHRLRLPRAISTNYT